MTSNADAVENSVKIAKQVNVVDTMDYERPLGEKGHVPFIMCNSRVVAERWTVDLSHNAMLLNDEVNDERSHFLRKRTGQVYRLLSRGEGGPTPKATVGEALFAPLQAKWPP